MILSPRISISINIGYDEILIPEVSSRCQAGQKRKRGLTVNGKLSDIVAAAVCRFNVEIDDRNQMAASISAKACDATCDYCRLQAEYIAKQIKESEYVYQQPPGKPRSAH
jgi:hypothetical protein